MIQPPSGYIQNMDSMTRNPRAKLRVSWANVLLSGEWFRLDQSVLDGGGLLTMDSYLQGETILEYLNEIDAYNFEDETEFVKSIEGYSELLGDNYQSSVSDFDAELVNTNNRFTPRDNKNKLKNPSFENSFDYWNLVEGFSGDISIDERTLRTGIRSSHFINPSGEHVYEFSDTMPMNDGNETEVDEWWSYSQYLIGSGIAYIELKAFDSLNFDANNLTTGLLGTKSAHTNLVSGVWNRPEVNWLVPSGSIYLRALISISGGYFNADDGQVENNLVATPYDPDFIGDMILPKRVIKAEVGFGTLYVPKFSGLIDKIHPQLKDDTVQIYAYDWADRLKDTLVTEELYQNKRSDELISILADKIGISAEKRNFDVGAHLVEFAWFPEASVWYYMTQIAEAEGGRIFFDEEGTLNFWNRGRIATQGSESVYDFTIDDHIIDLNYDISKDKIKNRIVVKASPKMLLGRTVIFKDNTGSSVPAGTTSEIWAQFSFGDDKSVPAINVEIPTLGVELIANSISDGSGTDVTGNLTITSYSLFAESLKLNIHNAGGVDAYFTTFLIYGEPIVVKTKIEVIEEDAASQILYDVQELQIENDFIDSEEYATNLAVQRLDQLKEPRNFITMDVVGVPYLQLGDIVGVEGGFDRVSKNYSIVKNRWQLTDDFIQSLELERKIVINFFILDESTLDSSDKLYL